MVEIVSKPRICAHSHVVMPPACPQPPRGAGVWAHTVCPRPSCVGDGITVPGSAPGPSCPATPSRPHLGQLAFCRAMADALLSGGELGSCPDRAGAPEPPHRAPVLEPLGTHLLGMAAHEWAFLYHILIQGK